MQRHLPRCLPVLALAVLAAACGGFDRSIETAMAENEPLLVIDLTEPPGSSSTTTPLPVVTQEPVVSTTTMAPPVDERPLSQGQGATRAARGRIASDGNPTFDGDFADPFLLPHEGDFYAYATNTLFMNVPVLASYRDGSGGMVGDALPELPAWSEPHHVWAPSVSEVDGTYVLHYTARHTASGRQCISVAVADHPVGPFVDASTEPLVCTFDLGGSIDPSTVADEDGSLWLLWKSDGNCCGIPTMLFAQPLSADGTELAGPAVELLRNDRSWERDVVEAPSMIEVDGEYHLFYSANRWDTEAYAVGHAICESVAGPCVKDPEPWLADTEATSGPGGLEVVEAPSLGTDLVVYHGWTGDLVGYGDGGVRSLYARPIRWVDGEPVLVERNAA